MKSIKSLFSWIAIATVVGVFLGSLMFYRLTLHHLAKLPGPRLAPITRWYEGYYDVIQDGQYTFKIRKLHQEYGEMVLHYQLPKQCREP